MNFDNIEKWSLKYGLLRAYAKLFFTSFYRKIYVTNAHKFPRNTATIVVSNHQNTLMDPLGIIFAVGGQLVYLARADIFKNPIAAKVMKIMPVYRSRDGGDTIKKNEEIFNKSIDVINNKMPFAIFPEGTHFGQRRLRVLKKGFARIAFKVMELSNYKLDLKIVPVAVDYSNYYKSGETLLMNFGNPINVADYIEQYKENPQKALNTIKNDVTKELKATMLHIQSAEYYDVFYEIKVMYQDRMIDKMGLSKYNHPNRFIAGQKIVENLDNYLKQKPDEVEKLSVKTRKYIELKELFYFNEWVLNKEKHSISLIILQAILMIATLPIFLFGAINNAVPYIVARRSIRKVKDPQFYSTTKYGYAMVLFPLVYGLIFLLS